MSRFTAFLFTLSLAITLAFVSFYSFESYVAHSKGTKRRVKLLPGSHLPSDAWFDSILSVPTGPNDFAAVGDAVGAASSLIDIEDAPTLDANEALHTRGQLKSAVLHLFPFVSAHYKTRFSSLQQHANNSQGIVIPCFNTDFQFALHLVSAGGPLIALPNCLQQLSAGLQQQYVWYSQERVQVPFAN